MKRFQWLLIFAVVFIATPLPAFAYYENGWNRIILLGNNALKFLDPLDFNGQNLTGIGSICLGSLCISDWTQLNGSTFNITPTLTLPASNISAGSFGSNTGGGNYSFPDRVSTKYLNVTGPDANATFSGDVQIIGKLYGGSPVKIAGGLDVLSGSATFNDIYVTSCTGCSQFNGTTNFSAVNVTNGTFQNIIVLGNVSLPNNSIIDAYIQSLNANKLYNVSALNNAITLSWNNITNVPSGSFSLEPFSKSAIIGQTVTIDVIANSGGAYVDGVDVYLSYDNSSLQFVGLTNGTVLTTNYISVNSTLIKFSELAPFLNPLQLNNTLLSTITFTAVKTGNTYLNFMFTYGNTLDSNMAAGGYEILGRVSNGAYVITNGIDENGVSIPQANITGGISLPYSNITNTPNVTITYNESGIARNYSVTGASLTGNLPAWDRIHISGSATTTTTESIKLNFNGDTSAKYLYRRIQGLTFLYQAVTVNPQQNITLEQIPSNATRDIDIVIYRTGTSISGEFHVTTYVNSTYGPYKTMGSFNYANTTLTSFELSPTFTTGSYLIVRSETL